MAYSIWYLAAINHASTSDPPVALLINPPSQVHIYIDVYPSDLWFHYVHFAIKWFWCLIQQRQRRIRRRPTSPQPRLYDFDMFFYAFLYFIFYLNRSGLIFILAMHFFGTRILCGLRWWVFWWASRITAEPEKGADILDGWVRLGFDFHLSERFFLYLTVAKFADSVQKSIEFVDRCIYMRALIYTEWNHCHTD